MEALERLLQEVTEAQLELKKMQERIVLRALAAAASEQLAEQGEELRDSLDSLGQTAKSQLAAKVISGIEGIFEGKAADSAKSQLSHLPAPVFDNPIRA
ncbi:hypothetical protein [Streptococcus macacae]|uniref:Uncharacterized protein n=1 Tax=Streptococcus macacae NCTC 11558 TaxID=764298 RepID=G5JYU7_9STRE|nr:hypothetical protein [Streptococcus macacae]EHJ51799.1 hypothetical protein STRMA_0361 [Streptococcus macacae NCTC 11558]SUN78204.1 Uncharacterised protein [Streptococcus macacae NCTC 11558]